MEWRRGPGRGGAFLPVLAPDSRLQAFRSRYGLIDEEENGDIVRLERLKKNCGRSERGFLGFGEALAKEQVCITL
jgi:hypothetical protein